MKKNIINYSLYIILYFKDCDIYLTTSVFFLDYDIIWEEFILAGMNSLQLRI